MDLKTLASYAIITGKNQLWLCVESRAGVIERASVYMMNPAYPDRVSGAQNEALRLGHVAIMTDINNSMLPQHVIDKASSSDVKLEAIHRDLVHIERSMELGMLTETLAVVDKRMDALLDFTRRPQVVDIVIKPQRTIAGTKKVASKIGVDLAVQYEIMFMGPREDAASRLERNARNVEHAFGPIFEELERDRRANPPSIGPAV